MQEPKEKKLGTDRECRNLRKKKLGTDREWRNLKKKI